ncbi:hypothetical protein BLA60_14580 [Actinophytocola xinjiangensis]|uniref:Uncharacterized protein n=1 Tax=Actinophytocola xinjiangensis TaxID=485602 RepID=A0A7Z1AYZ4_9PSEU|nr:hypothetical protein [Actinophytocola xinjiangensis]OLF11197.1 hypothetical protein BLA60_14580 [Actinophytocola xinjiangensis]
MQINVGLDALQSLTNFTEHSQSEQNDFNKAHSVRNTESATSGLAGSVQNAAFAVGQDRDAHWNSRVLPQIQQLVENNNLATSAYYEGQATSTTTMQQHTYGVGSVINGA